MTSERRPTQVRFDADLHERLDTEAKARMVSVSWLVNRLVRESLDRLVPVEEYRLTRPAQER